MLGWLFVFFLQISFLEDTLIMALVAYDSSDCSDLEDEITLPSANNEEKSHFVQKNSDISSRKETVQENSFNLFTNLPKPSAKQLIEEDDEFLHKSETVKREKAKINIPSLADFDDVQDTPTRKQTFQPSGKKSGLLSMLPEPKFSSNSSKKISKPLIPQSVEKKMLNPNPCPAVLKPASSGKTTVKPVNPLIAADYSGSDEDENDSSDFFSINTNHEQLPVEDNLPIEPSPLYAESLKEEDHVLSSTHEADFSNTTAHDIIDEQTDQSQSEQIELDDEAIRQLCGSRNKRKKEEISMITVDQQQVLSDSREWLLKGLMDDTTKRVSASKRKGNEPTSQQRKKHQITYLAHQAKANEADLQNQWANNRMTKRQTQSKYGF